MSSQNSSTGKTSGMTLDQLLAQNIGIEISDTIKQSTSQGSSVKFSFTGHNSGLPMDNQFPNQFSCNAGQQGTSSLSNVCVAGMIELANRTIVVFRNKTTSVSSQKYFSDWILKSFNLPDKSIIDTSQIYDLEDFYAIFIVLGNKRSYENILALYRCSSFNADQFIIVPASEILREGTLAMQRLKQQGGELTINNNETLPLNTCFLSLLEDNRSQNSSQNGSLIQSRPPEQLDSNRIIWENIAAAMIPEYRRLLATDSLPCFSEGFSSLKNSTNSEPPNVPKRR